MAQPNQSKLETEQSSSQQLNQENKNSGNNTKDLGVLTKNIVDNKSSAFEEAKEHPIKDIKEVQKKFDEEESKIFNLLKNTQYSNSDRSKVFAQEYEEILKENVAKLKQIIREDFDKSNENTHRLIEEAKNNVQSILAHTFAGKEESTEEFAKTIETIFININEKLRDDLTIRSKNLETVRSSLMPDYSNVFVSPATKSPAEVEAELQLQKMFEDELRDYSEHFKNDFKVINQNLVEQVEETKEKLFSSIQSAIPTEKPHLPSVNLPESKSLPDFPASSAVQKNINSFLEKTEKDFQNANENIKNDIVEKREKINENVKYYAKKVMGTGLWNNDDDDDEE